MTLNIPNNKFSHFCQMLAAPFFSDKSKPKKAGYDVFSVVE